MKPGLPPQPVPPCFRRCTEAGEWGRLEVRKGVWGTLGACAAGAAAPRQARVLGRQVRPARGPAASRSSSAWALPGSPRQLLLLGGFYPPCSPPESPSLHRPFWEKSSDQHGVHDLPGNQSKVFHSLLGLPGGAVPENPPPGRGVASWHLCCPGPVTPPPPPCLQGALL